MFKPELCYGVEIGTTCPFKGFSDGDAWLLHEFGFESDPEDENLSNQWNNAKMFLDNLGLEVLSYTVNGKTNFILAIECMTASCQPVVLEFTTKQHMLNNLKKACEKVNVGFNPKWLFGKFYSER